MVAEEVGLKTAELFAEFAEESDLTSLGLSVVDRRRAIKCAKNWWVRQEGSSETNQSEAKTGSGAGTNDAGAGGDDGAGEGGAAAKRQKRA